MFTSAYDGIKASCGFIVNSITNMKATNTTPDNIVSRITRSDCKTTGKAIE